MFQSDDFFFGKIKWLSHAILWHPMASHGEAPPVARLWTAPWISSFLLFLGWKKVSRAINFNSRGDMEKAWKIQSQCFSPFFLDLYSRLLAGFPWFSSKLRCLTRSSPSLFGLISLGVGHFGPQLLHPLPGRPSSIPWSHEFLALQFEVHRSFKGLWKLTLNTT